MKIEASVAVVFGAARGIGLAYTKALLERGASVSQGTSLCTVKQI